MGCSVSKTADGDGLEEKALMAAGALPTPSPPLSAQSEATADKKCTSHALSGFFEKDKICCDEPSRHVFASSAQDGSGGRCQDRLSGDSSSSGAVRMKKTLLKQLTLQDMDRVTNQAQEAGPFSPTWTASATDQEEYGQDEEPICCSPRGSFIVKHVQIRQSLKLPPAIHPAKKSLMRSLSSFSLASNTDAEGGDMRSFSEKSFKQKGDSDNAEDYGIYVTCRKGAKTKKAPNQDSWYVQRSDTHAVYSVFDGHGRKGHDISNFVKRNLPKLIENDARFRTDMMHSLIAEAFEEMAHLIVNATEDKQIDARKSGTTATIIIHDFEKELLTVAHVGDSGAALATGLQLDSRYLTPDHSPAVESERLRVEECGGHVEFDGYNHRVYLRDGGGGGGSGGPGLNMTRAFGDLSGAEAGIISLPDVTQVKLTSNDQILVVCSDGVWEFMPVPEVVELTNKALVNKGNPAQELAVTALKRWNENADVVDDITCIVVDLMRDKEQGHHPRLPRGGTGKLANAHRKYSSEPGISEGSSKVEPPQDVEADFNVDCEGGSPAINCSVPLFGGGSAGQRRAKLMTA